MLFLVVDAGKKKVGFDFATCFLMLCCSHDIVAIGNTILEVNKLTESFSYFKAKLPNPLFFLDKCLII